MTPDLQQLYLLWSESRQSSNSGLTCRVPTILTCTIAQSQCGMAAAVTPLPDVWLQSSCLNYPILLELPNLAPMLHVSIIFFCFWATFESLVYTSAHQQFQWQLNNGIPKHVCSMGISECSDVLTHTHTWDIHSCIKLVAGHVKTGQSLKQPSADECAVQGTSA